MNNRMSELLLEPCKSYQDAAERLAEHANLIRASGKAEDFGVILRRRGGWGVWLVDRRAERPGADQ